MGSPYFDDGSFYNRSLCQLMAASAISGPDIHRLVDRTNTSRVICMMVGMPSGFRRPRVRTHSVRATIVAATSPM